MKNINFNSIGYLKASKQLIADFRKLVENFTDSSLDDYICICILVMPVVGHVHDYYIALQSHKDLVKALEPFNNIEVNHSTLEKFSTEDIVSSFGEYNYPLLVKSSPRFQTATSPENGVVIPIGIWDPDTQCIYLNATGRKSQDKFREAMYFSCKLGRAFSVVPTGSWEDAEEAAEEDDDSFNASEETFSIAGMAKIAKELITDDFEVDVYRDDDDSLSDYGRPCITIDTKQKSPYAIWIFEVRDEIDDVYTEYGENMFMVDPMFDDEDDEYEDSMFPYSTDPDDYEITGYSVWLKKDGDTIKTWEGSSLQSYTQDLEKCIKDVLLAK